MSYSSFQDDCDVAELQAIGLLVQCLIIIVRHFDNIHLIIKSNFISCIVEICHHLLNVRGNNRNNSGLSAAEGEFIKICCEFLELVYDPFLRWRFFRQTHQLSSLSGSSYHVDPQLHPEIVPFIYTSFEEGTEAKRITLNTVGVNLLNVLGSITVGSARNGRLVICPATINVIMKILSDWSANAIVRQQALDNANIMLIVLLKSSPVERQIEVDVVVLEYLTAVKQLIALKVFDRQEEEQEEDLPPVNNNYRDGNALLSILQNVTLLLCESSTKISMCHALLDGNLVGCLVEVAEKISNWDGEMVVQCLASVVEVIALVSNLVNYQLSEKVLRRLFHGVRASAAAVDRTRLVRQCLSLATHPKDPLVVNSMVVVELVRWLPDLTATEQEVIVSSLMDVCTRNSNR